MSTIIVDGIQTVGVHNGVARVQFIRLGPDGKLRESFFDGVKWNGPIALPQFGDVESQPGVAVAPSGHQYLFWKGPDGNLFVAHWTGMAWEGPSDVGMGPLGSHPAAVLDSAERPFVYWHSPDDALMQAFYDGTKWNGPTRIGMGPLGSAVAASANPNGTRSVFWRGADGNLWAGVWSGSAWLGPVKVIGAAMTSQPTAGVDAAVLHPGTDHAHPRGADHRLDVAVTPREVVVDARVRPAGWVGVRV